MKSIKIILVSLMIVTMLFSTACGGSSDSTAGGGSGSGLTDGIAVDPYIEGAQFAEVDSSDKVIQISTPSDENGQFSFTNGVTSGNFLVMVDKDALHNGYTFNGILKRYIDQTDGNVVVSPLTTLHSLVKDNSTLMDELLDELDIDENQLKVDPMENIRGKLASELNPDDMKLIKKNIAVQTALQSVMGAVDDSSLETLLINIEAGTGSTVTDLNDAINQMDSLIDTAVDNAITAMREGENVINELNIPGVDLSLYKPKAEDILATAQIINDYVSTQISDAGTAAAKISSAGTIAGNLNADKITEIGTTAYLQRLYNNSLDSDVLNGFKTALTDNIASGYSFSEDKQITINALDSGSFTLSTGALPTVDSSSYDSSEFLGKVFALIEKTEGSSGTSPTGNYGILSFRSDMTLMQEMYVSSNADYEEVPASYSVSNNALNLSLAGVNSAMLIDEVNTSEKYVDLDYPGSSKIWQLHELKDNMDSSDIPKDTTITIPFTDNTGYESSFTAELEFSSTDDSVSGTLAGVPLSDATYEISDSSILTVTAGSDITIQIFGFAGSPHGIAKYWTGDHEPYISTEFFLGHTL